MKYRSLRKWSNPENLEGLVFFAQLCEELLFDYSLDTYKPSALNTATLLWEAYQLIGDIEEEHIDQNNLKFVTSELVENLRKDAVAKSLLDVSTETLAKRLLDEQTPLTDLKTTIEILAAQIPLSRYKTKVEELILSAVDQGNEKNKIRSLARTYITTLVNIGFSTRHLYPTFRSFFFTGKGHISSASMISELFEQLSVEQNIYTVVFEANHIFNEIEDSCGDTYAKDHGFGGDDCNGPFLILNEIKALDVFSARYSAERRVEMLGTLTSLFHHKEQPFWSEKALVINTSKNKANITNPPENPMLMCADLRTPQAAVRLKSFITGFSMSEEHSFKKFTRVTELHSLALKSDSPENQLLNLWIALETIVPSKLGRSKAKINNVIDSIIPFLNLDYLDTLTGNLTKDICRWDNIRLNKRLKDIVGSSRKDQLLRLLLLPENENAKLGLYDDLGHFYLLRNRAHYFSESLKSTNNILNLLEAHADRVSLQLRRIYRTRNKIVHSGHAPNFTRILIQNAHDYLDIVTNSIARLASEGNKINTIDQAFKYAEIRYTEYSDLLKSVDCNIDNTNIDEYLLKTKI